jgi:hypothetical protein
MVENRGREEYSVKEPFLKHCQIWKEFMDMSQWLRKHVQHSKCVRSLNGRISIAWRLLYTSSNREHKKDLTCIE